MAGAYCKFCQRRCFVYRIVPDGPKKGWSGHMATCHSGMEFDLKALGHTHLTSVNPITDPEAADAIAALLIKESTCRVCGSWIERNGNEWLADDDTRSCTPPTSPFTPHEPVEG